MMHDWVFNDYSFLMAFALVAAYGGPGAGGSGLSGERGKGALPWENLRSQAAQNPGSPLLSRGSFALLFYFH